MLARSRHSRRFARWLFSIAACFAIVAQLAVALAPLADGQGRSAAAHVEVGGTAAHYAHNDATCAVCQARSLQGFALRTPAPLPTRTFRPTILVEAAEWIVTAELLSHSSPRAPPSSI